MLFDGKNILMFYRYLFTEEDIKICFSEKVIVNLRSLLE